MKYRIRHLPYAYEWTTRRAWRWHRIGDVMVPGLRIIGHWFLLDVGEAKSLRQYPHW